MRQSITTKYIPPSNYKGSRISVRSSGGIRRIYKWDDRLNSDQNHAAAARKLIEEMGWNQVTGAWVPGATVVGVVYVFTYATNFDNDPDGELIIPSRKVKRDE